MTKKHKINDQEFYRQYSRLVSDFVQFVREQSNGCYSDGISYADTLKMDVFDDDNTYELVKSFTDVFILGNKDSITCYFQCGMFDVEVLLEHNYEDLQEVIDTLGSALIEYTFNIKDYYRRIYKFSSVFNVEVIK